VSWTVRTIKPKEHREYVRVCELGFGNPSVSDDEFSDNALIGEIDRNHVAVEGDSFVGTAGAYTFDLTIPGLATLPMAGVTDVGVAPTHRRQGILTALMAFQLDDVASRGEPIAGLTASEGGIYRRFGYGVATRRRTLVIATPRSRYLREPACGGRLRLIDRKDTTALLGPVWAQHAATTVGGITRRDAWFELYERDRDDWRDGASAFFRVVHESDAGVVDGYAVYRVKGEWNPGGPAGEVRIDELVGADPEITAALWRYCLDVDLTVSVKAFDRGTDDPIRYRFADQRCVQTVGERDFLWLRFLDVAACLTARAYAGDGALNVKVVDTFRPATGGTFRLEVADGVAACEPTKKRADLVLDTADLAATYLGGTSFTALADAGMVDERSDGAVARADSLFRTARPPVCHHGF
jgi:predicted acetyltransferase